MVDLASKNLVYDKLKFVITLSGVAFSVMLVFIQMGLFIGILDNATITIDKLPADLWITAKGAPNVDFAGTFPDSRVQRVRSVPGVAVADNLIVSYMKVALPTGAEEGTVVYALENFDQWQFPWKTLEGKLSDLRRGPYVFIDASASRRLGDFEVGDYREFHGRRLKIIGRSADALSFTTTPMSFMSFRMAQQIQSDPLADKTSYVLVRVQKQANLAAVQAEIARRLPNNDVLTASEWANRTRRYWIDSTGLGLNMFVTVFLGGLVGLVVVAQTLYASTMEHLKEFGTVKAIGGDNREIYKILARQATICALGGFLLGVLPTAVAAWLVPRIALKLIIPPALWLSVLAGSIIMCLAAAAISFRRVAAIDPAMVFRA